MINIKEQIWLKKHIRNMIRNARSMREIGINGETYFKTAEMIGKLRRLITA